MSEHTAQPPPAQPAAPGSGRRAWTAGKKGTGGVVTTVAAAVLFAVPVLTALFGPLLAPLAEASGPGAPYALDGRHPLGTDGLGRDVLALLLRGGGSTLGSALGAVALAYLVGGAVGLAAAVSRHRWVDEMLMRPVEVVLPIPSLLVISLVGVGRHGNAWAVTMAVALVNTPVAARLVRAAALRAAAGPVAEAMRMQGESRLRVQLGYVGGSVLPVVAADVGTRVTGAVFTVAAANFLGLGMEPTAPDWGVTIAASREALLVQPWSVCAPAAMLLMFTVGLNLLGDRVLDRRDQLPPRGHRDRRARDRWTRVRRARVLPGARKEGRA
ncbi:ABC transporter permease [Streptomyces diacarni]|uniref:ABC transporter permease n=1 Tax=Streptomyces diacarni TaxID=2800381 RepID=A0A367F4B5_9ACTN|nr:ABC transporter permease [Streptomyces diacarni]RCG24702.1 ABC transporter permease [Streptomyces diacarni]